MTNVLKVCINLLAVTFLVGSLQGCVSDPALNKALGLSSVPASKQAYAAKHKKPPVKTNKKTKKGKKKKQKTQKVAPRAIYKGKTKRNESSMHVSSIEIINLYNTADSYIYDCFKNEDTFGACPSYYRAANKLDAYCSVGSLEACDYYSLLTRRRIIIDIEKS